MYKRSTRLSINYRNFVISSHLPMLNIFKSTINYDIKNCDDRTKFSKIDKRFFFFLTNWEKKRKIEYEKLVANRWSGCYIPNTHNVFFRLKSMKQSRWKPGWIPFRNDARGDTGFLLLRCLIESVIRWSPPSRSKGCIRKYRVWKILSIETIYWL